MKHNTCTRCKETKPETEFRIKVKAKNLRIALCHPCDKEYRAERYKRADRTTYLKERDRIRDLRRQRVATGEIVEPKAKDCLGCNQTFPITSFRWSNESEGRRVGRCSECDVAFRAKKYSENPEQFLNNKKRTQGRLKLMLNQLKADPCMDCGGKFPPYVMDFDHRDPSTKICKVSSLVYSSSEQLLMAEIAKCDLVCANCHRIRTHKNTDRGHHDSD